METQATEIIHLKTVKAEQENKIHLLEEKKNTLDRDITLKNKLVSEVEIKMRATQDDSDINKYTIHEQSKVLTE